MTTETPAVRFFRALYGDVPPGLAILVRLVADPDRDKSVNRAVLVAKYYPSFDGLPAEWPNNVNVFFGVALREQGRSPAVMWTALFCDYDKEWTGELPANLPPPTAVVKSGRGYHLYWALRDAVYDKAVMYDYLRRLQVAVGADPRAAEPERLLRVPGTLNVKYEQPLSCELVSVNDQRYALSDFDHLPPVPAELVSVDEPIVAEKVDWAAVADLINNKDLTNLAYAGWTEEVKAKYESASELDMAVVIACYRVGLTPEQAKGFWLDSPGLMRAKARKRPDYIDRTIRSAYKWAAEHKRTTVAASYAGLEEHGKTLHIVKSDGETREVSNFIARPLAIFDDFGGQGGAFRVRLESARTKGHIITLDSAALASASSFKPIIPVHYVWKGDSRDLARFQEYLLAQEPPVRKATYTMGWHKTDSGLYLITSHKAWGPDGIAEPDVMYAGDTEWVLTPPDPNWKEQVAEVIQMLLLLHRPEVVWAVMGWLFSAMVAPMIREVRGGLGANGEFSGLWVWGEQGAGKTQTVEQFLRLTASPHILLSSKSTQASLQRVLSSINCAPVFVDDPRKFAGRDDGSDLLSLLRGTFGAETITLSQSGTLISVHRRTLWAPNIIASEQAIERDEATTQRYMHVLVDKGYRMSNPQSGAILRALQEMPLETLALGIYQALMGANIPALWSRSMRYAEPIRGRGEDDRPVRAVAQILVGLMLAETLAPVKFDYPEVAERIWKRSYQDTGRDSVALRSQALKDITRGLWNAIAVGIMIEGRDYRVIGDSVAIVLNRIDYALKQLRDVGGLPLTPSVVLQAIAANPDIVHIEQVPFPGGKNNKPRCVVYNLYSVRTNLDLTEEPWQSQKAAIL